VALRWPPSGWQVIDMYYFLRGTRLFANGSVSCAGAAQVNFILASSTPPGAMNLEVTTPPGGMTPRVTVAALANRIAHLPVEFYLSNFALPEADKRALFCGSPFPQNEAEH
jgi:hypothetical protein